MARGGDKSGGRVRPRGARGGARTVTITATGRDEGRRRGGPQKAAYQTSRVRPGLVAKALPRPCLCATTYVVRSEVTPV